jgi:hypothetical protein
MPQQSKLSFSTKSKAEPIKDEDNDNAESNATSLGEATQTRLVPISVHEGDVLMNEYDGSQNFEVSGSRDVSGIDDLNAIGMLTP